VLAVLAVYWTCFAGAAPSTPKTQSITDPVILGWLVVGYLFWPAVIATVISLLALAELVRGKPWSGP
jgi:hypothetical protein